MALTRVLALKLEPADYAALELEAIRRGVAIGSLARSVLIPQGSPSVTARAPEVFARPRTKDDLNTPPFIVAPLAHLGGVMLDPCTNGWSVVGARLTYSWDRGEDGLALPWACGGLVYENPPYSRGQLERWARKAKREAAFAELVSCVPTSPDTEAWAIRMSYACARVDLGARVRFGGGHTTGRFASTLFYSGPRPYLFAHAFSHLGHVAVYRARKLRRPVNR